MAESVAPPRSPTSWQVASALAQNIGTMACFFGLAYLGKLDGNLCAILIAGVSGLDLAKVARLRAPGGMSALLGAVGVSQWLGRVG